MSEDHDFDFEPLPGVPSKLPEGERLIWRGAPDPWRLGARAFRLPIVGAYFVGLAGWQLAGLIHAGATTGEMFDTLSWTAALGVSAVLILALLGLAIAKNTIYTITTRRVIIRHGVAMPMAINIPFAQIGGASHRGWADGTGDIALKLLPGSQIFRLLLWPHVRPGIYAASQPTLRAVPDGARVAQLLAAALAETQNEQVAMASGTAPAWPVAPQPQAAAARGNKDVMYGNPVMT
ncbi:MAG: photosynthetic complex putative assembly protein PuhB [Hyphomicrobiaceae bacterium]